MKKFAIYSFLAVFILTGLIISGCGGSGGGGSLIPGAPSTNSVSSGAGTGSMSFSFQWPGYSKNTGKYISHITNSIDLSITMENFQTSKKYSRPDNGIVTDTIEGLPEGEATILVEAKDLNGELLAQRFITQKITDGLNASLSIDLGVTIDCAGFTPQTITVPINTTLMWVNNDTVSHSLVNVMYGFVVGEKGIGPFDGKVIFPGSSKSYKFSEAGTYMYKESSNDSLMGTVEVKGVPVVTGIEPFAILDSERGTRSITITGDNYWSEQGSSKVYFNGVSGPVEANVTSWANDSITCTIPFDAVSGDVIVKVADSTSNSRYLSVFSFESITSPSEKPLLSSVFAIYGGNPTLFVGAGDATGGGIWTSTLTVGTYTINGWSGNIGDANTSVYDLKAYPAQNAIIASGLKVSPAPAVPSVITASISPATNFNVTLPFDIAATPAPSGPAYSAAFGDGKWWCTGNINTDTGLYQMFLFSGTFGKNFMTGDGSAIFDVQFSLGPSPDALAVGENNKIYAYDLGVWQNISGDLPPGNYNMKNVIFSPSDKGYIAGNKKVGGIDYAVVLIGDRTPRTITLPANLLTPANSIFMATSLYYDAANNIDHVWAAGTELWYSHDTGDNWVKLNINSNCMFMDIYTINNDVIYGVGAEAGTSKIFKLTRI